MSDWKPSLWSRTSKLVGQLLSATALAIAAPMIQAPPAGRTDAASTATEHPGHHGRRYRPDAGRRLSPRGSAWRNAQHRPHRPGGGGLYPILRNAKLYLGTQCFLHRDVPAAHG